MKNNNILNLAFIISLSCLCVVFSVEYTKAKTEENKNLVHAETEMKFIWVPNGCFIMGKNENIPLFFGYDGDGFPNSRKNIEGPARKVCISKGFWIGKFEVNQMQWKQVMGYNPSIKSGLLHPVESISWIETKKFLQRMNHSGPWFFRLPTEAEWEFACQSGGLNQKNKIYCGGNISGDVGWCNLETHHHPVGGKLPNGLGIHDMSGNVAEWVGDWFSDYPNGGKISFDPEGPESGLRRVVRGGSAGSRNRECSATSRTALSIDNKLPMLGFRVVRSR